MNPETNHEEGRLTPLHRVTPLSKYLAMALFIILPFLGGYIGYVYAPEKVVEVEKEATVSHSSIYENPELANFDVERYFAAFYQNSTLTSDLKKYTDESLGISFEYPAVFGEITKHVEHGKCPDDYTDDPCEQVRLSATGNSPWKTTSAATIPFLGLESRGHADYPVGRGVYWIDYADTYDKDYLTNCQQAEKCEVIENQKGLLISKTLKPINCIYDCGELAVALSTGYEYGIYSPGGAYQHIIMTVQPLTHSFWSGNRLIPVFENTVVQTLSLINQ